MQELILIFSCLNTVGCSDTFSVYSYYNKNTVKTIEQLVENSPEWTKKYGPFVVCGLNQNCSVKLNNNLTLGTKKEGFYITFQAIIPN